MKIKKLLFIPALSLIGSGLSGCAVLPIVTWVNYDGSTLEVDKDVFFGSTPTYDGKTPQRPSTPQYEYEFKGWDKEIKKVWALRTQYKAQYKESTRSYTIVFQDNDGNAMGYPQTVKYGDMPEIPQTDRDVDYDSQYTYTFEKWDKEPTSVTGDATYTAIYKKDVREYTVKFVNWDGSVISEEVYEYGEMPVVPTDLTRDMDSEKKYTFSGWNKEVKEVTGEAVYIAQYSSVNIYKITFENWDGSILKEDVLEEGQMPVPPSDPERVFDEYAYKFKGWDKPIEPATKETKYTAQYDSRKREKFDLTYYLSTKENPTSFNDYTLQNQGFYIDWVYEHSEIDLPSFVKDHYDVKWYSTPTPGEKTKPLSRIDDIFDNLAFYGLLTEHKFVVEFDLNGGTSSGEYPTKITYPDSLNLSTLPEPSVEGYDFEGWFDEQGNKVEVLAETISDIKLTAQYNAKTYNITFNDPSVSSVIITAMYDSESYYSGLPTPEKLGYTFEYWSYNDAELKGPYTFLEDIEVNPVYHVDTYALTFELNEGKCENLPATYTIETYDQPIPSPEKVGYDFECWKITVGTEIFEIHDGESLKDCFGEALFIDSIADNFTLVAQYSDPHACVVSYNFNEGAPLHYVRFMDGEELVEEKMVAEDFLTAEFVMLPNKEGYQFAGWENEFGELVLSDLEINEDITLHARWNEITYRVVSVDPNDILNVIHEYDKTITINGGETVLLHNVNGTYLQFTSLIEQDITIKANSEFEINEISTSTSAAPSHSSLVGAENICEKHVLAGMSYLVKVHGIQNEDVSTTVSITSAVVTDKIPTPDFVISGNNPGGQDSVEIRFGDEIPGLIELAKDGYIFDGWFIGDKCYQVGDVLDVDSPCVTLEAHWHAAP